MWIRDLERLRNPEMDALERQGVALCRQASAEGSVLLENRGVLPLSPTDVALYGFGARQLINTGIGSGDVLPRYVIHIEQGLEEAGFRVLTKDWLEEFDRIYRAHREKLKRELQEESERTGIDCLHCLYSRPHEHIPCQVITERDLVDSDTAIYVISRKEGEGCDNVYAPGGYLLAEWEREQLVFLRRHYQKLIVLLNVGSVLDMGWLQEVEPDAVLLIFQGGAEIGRAVADVLTGAVPPSGKLTTTWAKRYEDYTSSQNFGQCGTGKEVFYKEGLYIGYRYFDSFQVSPRYPFGYGLTYTAFTLGDYQVEVEKDIVRLSLLVQNTGAWRGKEVVQAYLSSPAGELGQPYQQLCAFTKTRWLEAGDRETVSLSFSLCDYSVYNTEKEAYCLEAGEYVLRVGTSSAETQICAVLSLEEGQVIREVKNVYRQEEWKELCPNPEVGTSFVRDGQEDTERQESADKQGSTDGQESMDVPVFWMRPETFYQGRTEYGGEAVNYLGGAVDAGKVNLTAGKMVSVDVPQDISLPDVIEGRYTMEQLIASMGEEELIHLVTGQFYEHPPYKMNCYSPHVLGACGEMTNYFEEQGSSKQIPYVILADGGSGLRLIRRFQTDEQRQVIYLDPVLNCENGIWRLYRKGFTTKVERGTSSGWASCKKARWDICAI